MGWTRWNGRVEENNWNSYAFTHTHKHSFMLLTIFYHINITHTKSVSSKYPVNSFLLTVLPFWEHQTREHGIPICEWQMRDEDEVSLCVSYLDGPVAADASCCRLCLRPWNHTVGPSSDTANTPSSWPKSYIMIIIRHSQHTKPLA